MILFEGGSEGHQHSCQKIINENIDSKINENLIYILEKVN
jgi:hypothetical protein